ncbi:ABC transporter permease [Streptomyces sp. BR1]|uniref:ABC transporter permease n=1 Tax=Streptomyces sp. BR1 TaxID=1592323 RepID=UPI00402BF010
MSTLTRPAVDRTDAPAKPRRLRGLAWLMARQHRVPLLFCIAATVLGSLWIAYERGTMLDNMHAAGWPGTSVDAIDPALRERTGNTFNDITGYVSALPLLLGVFLAAPLVAADQEQGTARLVTTQSVPRMRWLRWKLGFAFGLAAVTTGVLGAMLTWYWRAAHPFISADWYTGPVLTTTGPMLVATAFFTMALGLAVGALVRRVVTAMTLTFFGSYAFAVLFDYVKPHLATPRRIAFPLHADPPVPTDVAQIDQWVGTASGKLYGYGTCVNADADTCRAQKGIVNSVWEYFGYDQMATLQWTAAAVLLMASAVLVALVLWRTRRRAL